MQSIMAAIREKWVWACLNVPGLLHGVLIGATLLFLTVRPASTNGIPTDLPLRFWGMFLQLFGAGTVWFDLTGTAKDFGARPFDTWAWVKSLFRTPPAITGSIAVCEGVDAMAGVGTVTATGDKSSLEERVASLEKRATGLTEQLTIVRHELKSQEELIRTDLKQLDADLSEEICVLKGQMTEAFTGNYRMLRVGAIWLVVGIFLSSIAVELTNLLHLHQLPKFW